MGYAYEDGTKVMKTHELINKLRWTTADFCHQAADKLERVGKLENELAHYRDKVRNLEKSLKNYRAAIQIKRATFSYSARKAIKEERQQRANDFLDFVIKYKQLDKDKFLKLYRGQDYIDVRHAYCHAVYELVPNIGCAAVGEVVNRNHATVIHAVKSVNANKKLKRLSEELISQYRTSQKK